MHCYLFGKPKPDSSILLILGFLLMIPLTSLALGSADLVVGINESSDDSYIITDILAMPSNVTVFASEKTGNTAMVLALIGENSGGALVNDRSHQWVQEESNVALAQGYNTPYYLWDLGNIKSAGWQFAFEYNEMAYYGKTVWIDGFNGKLIIRAFIDNNNNYYYSPGDDVSGFFGQQNDSRGLDDNPFSVLIINDSGQPILTKAYDGPYEPEDITTAEPPYLAINGEQVEPLADDHNDLLIELSNNVQIWTLLNELTPWQDHNIFGFYLDAGRARNRTTIFEGPRSEGYSLTTEMAAGTTIGLWLLNDINGDTLFNDNDSWLFSERFLTRNSLANEHQWFMVYDVSSYKGTGALYEFFSSAGDYSTTGDYDYLFYIDDDHTSANWDHDDMILGVNCTAFPDSCGNYPPGVPPNYSMIDSSYFIGEPILPLPPPDSGGVYIYLDTSNCYWTIASHIYSRGNSLEQFHGSLVSLMEEPPQLGVNVFIDNFELWEDTTDNRCLQQNDRWGWSLWDSTLGLYEIWWDVTTKEYMPDAEDINDFLIIQLQGTAIDFNLWSSGPHEGPFDEYQVFLGENKVPLGTIPGYHDYGSYDVIDQYQAAVGPDPTTDPNTSVFSTHCGPGESYNLWGEIDSSDSYYCDTNYGLNYAGAKTYQADGIQFSAYGTFCVDPCAENNPPICDVVNDTTYFVCGDTTFSFYITAFDPDENLVGCTKTSGPGVYDNEYWTFTTTGPGVYSASFECVDYCGAACTSTVNITVEYNSPPTASCLENKTVFVCDYETEVCIPHFYYSDPDDNIDTVEVFGCELYGDTVCFMPDGPTKVITMVVTDECGETDTCVTNVTLVLNNPPVVTCPNDTSLFVCDYSEICIPGFTYSDPDNNIDTVIVFGCEIYGDTVCFTPEGPSKAITFIAIDECGAADTCVTNIDITLNSPPVVGCAGDTSMFVCSLDDICLYGFTASDPDNNLDDVTVTGGTLVGSTVCFTPVEGMNTIILTATDSCGEVAACTTEVSVTLNSPPQVTCPGDTTLFVCDFSEICLPGFSVNDPDDNITDTSVTGGTLIGNEVCFTPVEGINTITLTATDTCGASDQCVTQVSVVLNSPPTASCPGDTNLFLCDLGQVCIDGFVGTDPDNNIVSRSVNIGSLVGTEVCFTPVEGLNTIVFTVTDACGETDQCSTQVNVSLNSPPTASCPGDTSLFLCELGQVCVDGFVGSDPDNNIASRSVNIGSLVGTEVCFTPVEGLNTIIFTVTDSCGATDQCSTQVNVSLNSPPQATCPGDTSVFYCVNGDVCISGFSSSDVDNNIVSESVSIGTLTDGTVCFTPTDGENIIIYTVVDDCGDSSQCQTSVFVQINDPPTASCPGDTSLFLCELGQVCVDGFVGSDPDNNIASRSVNIGSLVGTEVCFTPVEGLNTIVFTVTDSCGESDQCSTQVNVSLNRPPTASCPGDTSLFLCELGQVCVDGFVGSDPDNNIASRSVNIGNLVGTEVCFTPVEGLNTIIFTVTDSCGETDQCSTQVNVSLNSPPQATCPGDTTIAVCDLSTLCIDGFTYSDVDDNITDVVVTGGTLDGSQVCFTPQEGLNTITLTVTDACGEIAECTTNITVTLNNPPVATCPGNIDTLLCDLSEICIDGFFVDDVDDNIDTVEVSGGTLVGSQVCFTPVEGVNTITLLVTDECGETDQCFTEITVTLNSGPSVYCPPDTLIQVGELTDICLTGFGYSDPDDNIASVMVDNGTLSGDTVCFTPVEGVNTITLTAIDECGLSDECTTNITLFRNTCPEFIRPFADTTIMCVYEDFCDTIEVIDADGDYIEMSVNYGELIPIIDEPGHWLGLYCFGVEDYDCGEHNNYEVIIQCDDSYCEEEILVVFDITVLGYIDMYLDEDVYVMPGMTGLVGVYLDTYDCLCVGGLTASLFWDSAILNLVDVYPTGNLDFGNEYHNVNINAFGPGTVKLSYIADLNNQIYHGPLCEIDPDEPIFYLEFLVAPGEYPVDFEIPICFLNEEDINDNAISDSTGYHVWYGDGCSDQPDSSQFGTLLLNMECGSIIIVSECDLVVGDVNLNRVPFEVGDAVLLANHLINPDEYPFSFAQLWSSDVNGDSVRASIADLIMMINVINGIIPLGKVTPPDTPVNLVVAHQSDGSASIRIQSEYDVGGLVLDLPVPGIENRGIEINTDLGMDFEVREYGGGIRLLVYSNESSRLNPGINEILRIDNIEGLNIIPAEISVSDARGALADARVSHELPLPETFGITSCYPNPFNPTTTFEFTIPSSEYVTLTIYDVTGRVVNRLLHGYLEAGYHQVSWNGTNDAGDRVSSGVYFAKLEADNDDLDSSIEKVVLLK